MGLRSQSPKDLQTTLHSLCPTCDMQGAWKMSRWPERALTERRMIAPEPLTLPLLLPVKSDVINVKENKP
eukprot:6884648-Prymnesium_polylepis.1